jgi:DNA-binding transcriptional LysR family regulator
VSPELRHLRYFVAVAEERSFTRAAARLNVVQQGLSTAIKQLEAELGVQLLVRTSRRVDLTDAGRALLDAGRRSLYAVERSWDAARAAAQGNITELRVAYTLSVGFGALPTLHAAAAEQLPRVRVTWCEMWCREAVGGVATGRFDAGLARYPERLRGLAYETIGNERQAVLVHRKHRLRAMEEIALDDIAGETILTFPREMAPGYHDAMLDMMRAVGGEPRTIVSPETGHGRMKLSILESGAAVAVAPIGIAEEWARASADGLALLRLVEAAPRVPLHLFWDPTTGVPNVQRLVAVIRDAVRASEVDALAAAN